eukprot:6188992-Pleurochrysis_carterae.AAC.3
MALSKRSSSFFLSAEGDVPLCLLDATLQQLAVYVLPTSSVDTQQHAKNDAAQSLLMTPPSTAHTSHASADPPVAVVRDCDLALRPLLPTGGFASLRNWSLRLSLHPCFTATLKARVRRTAQTAAAS